MERDRERESLSVTAWDVSVTCAGGAGGIDEPSLARHFYEALCRSEHEDEGIAGEGAGALLGEYAALCGARAERVPAWQRSAPAHAPLQHEADTWRLLHCLHQDQLVQLVQMDEHLNRDRLQPVSPCALVERLFADPAETDLRQMQLVADWLEQCSQYQDRLLPPPAPPSAALHWENTLHRLHNGSSLFESGRGASLLPAMDPDAPRRLRLQPHALDRQDDERLCRKIFKEIRCGRPDEAAAACADAGQMWRAVLLQGRRLLDYPEPPVADAKLPLVGNPARDLWKRACRVLLADPEENPHFRAALGVQCGDLASVLPLCGDSREDLLWAHLRVQIESRVDRRLRECCDAVLASPGEIAEPLEWTDSAPELSLHQIFGRVEAACGENAETFHQRIRRHLILNRTDSFLADAFAGMDSFDRDGVRFLAHLVLALRQTGKDASRDAGDAALKAYVRNLVEDYDGSSVCPDLIARYVSALPGKMQIAAYSDLMRTLRDEEDRRKAAEAGAKAGLNVRAAAGETLWRIVDALKNRIFNNQSIVSQSVENDGQYRKLVDDIVSALEWLSFDKSQISDAVAVTNAVMRILIVKGDVDSATRVLSRLSQFYPSAAIAKNLNDASSILREHLCLKAYLEAVNGYAAWYRRHATESTTAPRPPSADCSFTDRVHHQQMKAQSETLKERRLAAGAHLANHTKQLLYNVLLFPGGWLTNEPADEAFYRGEEFADRNKQSQSLRRLCIPEVVLLLLKVLQSGDVDAHAEAIRLSEILASDNRKLYRLFSKQKMREVLHKIGETSLCVLENNRDPWGFASIVI